MSAELKGAIESLGSSWEAYKKANDERVAKLAKGESVAELDAKLAKIHADVEASVKAKSDLEIEMKAQRERIEELEAATRLPGAAATEKAKSEYKDAFLGYLRSNGQDPQAERKLNDLQKKDITIGTTSAGGFAVPEEIARQIEVLERKMSPVRDLVKVVTVSTSDYKELVSIGNTTTSAWSSETGTRNATNTPELRERAPTWGELYAYPKVSEWALDDVFFNVEGWLTESVAQDFAIAEATAVLTGNGTNKPTGLLNTAPTSVADNASPMRAASVLQYIALVGESSPLALTADTLIDCFYTLQSAYRPNSTWVMNSATTGAVRKLKGSDNNYLWQPGLAAGVPDTLLGRPVSVWEQSADIADNALPILFGDFRRGYLLCERAGLRILRDPYSTAGYVKYYVRRREGGIVLNNDAVKAIKISET